MKFYNLNYKHTLSKSNKGETPLLQLICKNYFKKHTCNICQIKTNNVDICLRGHVQNPPAIKIHPRSKSIRSNLKTAYRARVRVSGNSDSKKCIKNKQKKY